MIKVVIIEDQPNIRESLRILIDGANGLQCAGVFETMEEGSAAMDRNLPDVALVDIGLPGMSGIQGIAKIRERFPAVLPLVLTVYNDDERIFQALCAGACGYLLKKTPPGRLLDCLTEAVAGGAPDVTRSGASGRHLVPTLSSLRYKTTSSRRMKYGF